MARTIRSYFDGLILTTGEKTPEEREEEKILKEENEKLTEWPPIY